MAEKTIDIAGKKVNKWVVYGGAGAVVVVAYIYFKDKNASSSSSTANSSAIDPVTGLPYSQDNTVDPLTGLSYLAEAEQYGSVSAAEAAFSGGGISSTGGGGTGSGIANGTPSTSNVNPVSTPAPATGFTTNAEWSQSAIAALEAMGYDSNTATSAIAAYLAGMSLTALQSSLVQLATSEIGPPPVSPPAITTTPAGSGSGAGTILPPVPTAKYQFPAPQNLTAESGGSGKIFVSWAPVVGPQGQTPTGYTVAYGRTSGAHTWENVVKGNSTTLTTQKGMTEYIEVWANGGPIAPPHAGPVKATAGS